MAGIIYNFATDLSVGVASLLDSLFVAIFTDYQHKLEQKVSYIEELTAT
jgi:hypothetical protein